MTTKTSAPAKTPAVAKTAAANPAAASTEKPADLAPASDVAASGALIEPEIVDAIDTSHPAVDANPRAGLPEASNQIDFNDPKLSAEEAVERNLKAQG